MPREDDAKEAMFDGISARRAGLAFDTNPQTPGTRMFSAWCEGWSIENGAIQRAAHDQERAVA